MRIYDILEEYAKMRSQYPHWRKGQTLFNALYAVNPEWGDMIRGTEFDPFYQDKKFHIALSWIEGMCDE